MNRLKPVRFSFKKRIHFDRGIRGETIALQVNSESFITTGINPLGESIISARARTFSVLLSIAVPPEFEFSLEYDLTTSNVILPPFYPVPLSRQNPASISIFNPLPLPHPLHAQSLFLVPKITLGSLNL